MGDNVRARFYGGFELTADMTPEKELTVDLTQPNHATADLFSLPNVGAPWNYGAGGSDKHKAFVYSRLFRTYAQFKKNPSGELGVGIIAAAQSEFKTHQSNRLCALGAYAVYSNGPANALVATMNTFPFRIIVPMDNQSNYPTEFRSQYVANVTELDSAATKLGLVDTTNNGLANAWDLDDIKTVSLNLAAKQTASVPAAAYPDPQLPHAKHHPFVHNAVGNLFEITDWVRTSAVHLDLLDIFWQDLPGAILCFNNYGRDEANQNVPKAFRIKAATPIYNREPSAGGTQENTQTGVGVGILDAGTGFNRMSMRIRYADLLELKDDESKEDPLTQANFDNYVDQTHAEGPPPDAPKLAVFFPGKSHVDMFQNDNYVLRQTDSFERGSVQRSVIKISQHLCAPVLNPDMRLGCIAPLNHSSRHLPPELRDFQLVLKDVDFGFLQALQPPVLGDIVLSEFNGGIQTVAAQESLLYLPNFIEYRTSVLDDMTFSVECMTGKGVPSFISLFCRDSDNMFEQPKILRLSLQNYTTMKKSDSVFDTDVHELYHMTQRNVHSRSQYDSDAYNDRQTILLATEDIGIMGLGREHYQRQKRVKVRVSGTCTNFGTVTVIFIYNNRGMYIKGRQQSVVNM